MSEERAKEIADLEAELAGHQHALRVRELRAQIEQHAARLAPPVREWHEVEFCTKGEAVRSSVIDAGTKGFKDTGEYHPQTAVCKGYYLVEDGEVVGLVDVNGNPIAEPTPEHRTLRVHAAQPYPAKPDA